MDELQKYPELLNELQKQPGLVDEVIRLKLNFKPRPLYNGNRFLEIKKSNFKILSGLELLPLIKIGFEVTSKNSILYAQDKIALQLMQYFGAEIDFKKDLIDFDIYKMSTFMIEEFWEEIEKIILSPKKGNNSIYTCENPEIFKLLYHKGIKVDEIVYPEKQYKYREDLYTYDLVCWYWNWSKYGTRKKDVLKFRGYKIDLDLVNFVVYQFDDFKKEVSFNWKGVGFTMPKWYLYFWEFFGPIKSGEYVKNYKITFVREYYDVYKEYIDKFFSIFNDLKISDLSSTGVNLFFTLLDCQIKNMLLGIEHLLDYNLDPLKKDINGISFFDVLLADETKYSKAIELIKSKVSLSSFVQTPIFLDGSKKTRIYPLTQDQNETSGIESSNVKENIHVRKSNKLIDRKTEKELKTSIKTNQLENTVTAKEVSKRLEVKQLTADQRYSLSIMKNYFKESIVTKWNELFQLNETTYDRSLFNGIEHTILYFLLLISKTSEQRELFTTYKEISFKLPNLKNEFENEELINEMIIFFKRLYIITNKVTSSLIVNEEKLFVIDVFDYNRYTIFSTYLSYVFIDMESITTTIKQAKETGLDNNAKFDLYWPRIYECTTDISSYLIKSMLFPFGVDLEDNHKHRIIADQIKLEGKL